MLALLTHSFFTFQIPFIALYRKENCLSLLEEEDRYYDDLSSKPGPPPKTRFHKVIFTIGFSLRTCGLLLFVMFCVLTQFFLSGHVLGIAALGCSDLRQKVVTSSEAQGCFGDVL